MRVAIIGVGKALGTATIAAGTFGGAGSVRPGACRRRG